MVAISHFPSWKILNGDLRTIDQMVQTTSRIILDSDCFDME